jgi:hypothetical protein
MNLNTVTVAEAIAKALVAEHREEIAKLDGADLALYAQDKLEEMHNSGSLPSDLVYALRKEIRNTAVPVDAPRRRGKDRMFA